MTNALVIVESPAKAKTIARYLGAGYVVESSIGHVRDLPANADEIPKAYKSQPWARLGIDVDNDFKPLYVVSRGKRDQIRKLRALLAEADELYIATDEDREGEAIAWHLIEVLNPRVPVKRMVFHEITRSAIQAAVSSPRDLDRRLVDAQEARRMLDRLYGYEVSPVLWKKVMPRLSAGRVQSVATRIVVERERQRIAFVSAAYWSVVGMFEPAVVGVTASGIGSSASGGKFKARLASLDGKRLATGRDFGSDGELANADTVVLDATAAYALVDGLADAEFAVRTRKAKPYRRRPAPPFITSTLQQEAARKLRMSSSVTMRTAQSLYEQGYITYMRTDSTTMSSVAVSAARAAVKERYGPALLPPKPRVYTGKVKNAQEAHEAIRPASDTFPTPQAVAGKVPESHARLYDLIWKRTLASQMTDCTGETVQLRLGAVSSDGSDAEFVASGTVITHMGFREVYTEGTDETDAYNPDAVGSSSAAGSDSAVVERRLPPLHPGDSVRRLAMEANGHETQPPARYTEASLVKRLEQLGVGRPSTYASILQTIVDRGYVWKKGVALVPSFTAFSVVNLLEGHFPKMVDYAFTAEMENDLDEIAGGSAETVPWLTRFYFGDGEASGLKEKVSNRLGDIDARAVNTITLGVDTDGVVVEVRVGRYGSYLLSGDRKASLPADITPDELTLEHSLELLAAPSDIRVLGIDPVSGYEVVARAGRFGPYVQLRPPEADAATERTGRQRDAQSKTGKLKTASLFKNMMLETVTLEDALKLLSLPRTIGVDPVDGAEITVHNGRYMPYVKKGAENRPLTSEDQIFTITLQECLELLSQPRQYRRSAPRPPLRELGEDPETGKAVVVRDGRFGHYVTDGDTNASLRTGDSVEGLTIERASELLSDRRAKGPVKKGARKKSAVKKGARKKSAVKKGARKKSAAKKGARKKSAAKKGARKKSAVKKGARKKSAAKKSSARKLQPVRKTPRLG